MIKMLHNIGENEFKNCFNNDLVEYTNKDKQQKNKNIITQKKF